MALFGQFSSVWLSLELTLKLFLVSYARIHAQIYKIITPWTCRSKKRIKWAKKLGLEVSWKCHRCIGTTNIKVKFSAQHVFRKFYSTTTRTSKTIPRNPFSTESKKYTSKTYTELYIETRTTTLISRCHLLMLTLCWEG